MSESERHVTIEGRCFDPVRIVQKEAIVGERLLLGAVCLLQACAVISCDRDFSEPVHICGHTFSELCLVVSSVTFATTLDSITVNYETVPQAKCQIIGAPWDPYDPLAVFQDSVDDLVTWYLNAAEHASPHSHTSAVASLPPPSIWPSNASYICQIHCTTAAGQSAWMPAANHYYWVTKPDDEGNGGGLMGILDENGDLIP